MDLESAGVLVVTVQECDAESLVVCPSPEPFPQHVHIDFNGPGFNNSDIRSSQVTARCRARTRMAVSGNRVPVNGKYAAATPGRYCRSWSGSPAMPAEWSSAMAGEGDEQMALAKSLSGKIDAADMQRSWSKVTRYAIRVAPSRQLWQSPEATIGRRSQLLGLFRDHKVDLAPASSRPRPG